MRSRAAKLGVGGAGIRSQSQLILMPVSYPRSLLAPHHVSAHFGDIWQVCWDVF